MDNFPFLFIKWSWYCVTYSRILLTITGLVSPIVDSSTSVSFAQNLAPSTSVQTINQLLCHIFVLICNFSNFSFKHTIQNIVRPAQLFISEMLSNVIIRSTIFVLKVKLINYGGNQFLHKHHSIPPILSFLMKVRTLEKFTTNLTTQHVAHTPYTAKGELYRWVRLRWWFEQSQTVKWLCWNFSSQACSFVNAIKLFNPQQRIRSHGNMHYNTHLIHDISQNNLL